jgi:ATP-dependent exoDNAse (exonuclease V) alpha subunit
VFIIDEISMMSNEDKQYIMDTYRDCKLIFCGDIGYQLPAIEGSPFMIEDKKSCEYHFQDIIYYNKNYRVKCDKLAVLLKEVREMIEYGINPRQLIIDTCKKGNDNDYDFKKDLIICSTHSTKDVYTEKYKHLEKYYVLQSDRIYGRGEIYFEKPNAKCEIRHAYTIHSIQGETAKGKLFINIQKIYNAQMLYTAISRAEYLDNIILI